MIWDAMIFYDENDLLEIRMDELALCDDWVTHIVVEGSKTFTGKEKESYFDEERFAKRKNIFRLWVHDMPEGTPWGLEVFQRNSIMKALDFLEPQPTDTVIISDVDEVPRAKQVNKFKGIDFAALIQDKYCYYLNVVESRQSWDRARIMDYAYLKDKQPEQVRNSGYDFSIHDAGWHWSYLGGIEAIRTKLRNFSHQEYNTPEFNNEEFLFKKMQEAQSLWSDEPLEIIQIDLSHPEYLLKKIDKYKHLIK